MQISLYIDRLPFLVLCKLMLMIFCKNCDSYEKTKNGTRIVLHRVCISASIDKFIGFKKLKNTLSDKQSCINF